MGSRSGTTLPGTRGIRSRSPDGLQALTSRGAWRPAGRSTCSGARRAGSTRTWRSPCRSVASTRSSRRSTGSRSTSSVLGAGGRSRAPRSTSCTRRGSVSRTRASTGSTSSGSRTTPTRGSAGVTCASGCRTRRSSRRPPMASRTWCRRSRCCSRPSTRGRRMTRTSHGVLPLLSPARRAWLAETLATVHAGHRWLDLL